MSDLKDLFSRENVSGFVSAKTLAELTSSQHIESSGYIKAFEEDRERYFPPADFYKPQRFARFGSAELYYENAIKRIYQSYPYDGSLKERIEFLNQGTYFDRFIFEYQYPRTNGYVNIGKTPAYTGAATTHGLKNSTSLEYILIKGGPHADPNADYKSTLSAGPDGPGVSKTNVYDADKKRQNNLRYDASKGVTLEFWLKKDGFADTNTSEVIFDLWNNNPLSSTANAGYGRLTVFVNSTSGRVGDINVVRQSGSFNHGLGSTERLSTGLTTIADSKWHHYAIVVKNTGSSDHNHVYLYRDGQFADSAIKTATLNEVTGVMQATLGAAITQIQGDSAGALGYGKLSGSLDEFRYWKTARTEEQIGLFYKTHIGGGTNTDDANLDLGVYYKFNEGITGDTSIDGTVLDYSGRVSNGAWTGYDSSISRKTDSAIVQAGAANTEFKDPIIYKSHPDVDSFLTDKKKKGKSWDNSNNASLIKSFPDWIVDSDEDGLKNLTQILASYLDQLMAQVEYLPTLKNIVYPTSSLSDQKITKPLPFADRLLEHYGFKTFPIFEHLTAMERYLNRDDLKLFKEKLDEVKNFIYQNIYWNLVNIYKSKGTERSMRNLIRCFGVDDELIKINLYGNNVTHVLEDNYKPVSFSKRMINFDNLIDVNNSGGGNPYEGTVINFRPSWSVSASVIHGVGIQRVGNAATAPFNGAGTDPIARTSTIYNLANTIAAEVFFSDKTEIINNYSPAFSSVSSSLFGMHQTTTGSSMEWKHERDLAAFQVYAVRDEVDSKNAKFVCTDMTGNFYLVSDTYQDVYSDTKWNFAVSARRKNYDASTILSGTSAASSADAPSNGENYILQFHGVNNDHGFIRHSFTLTASMNEMTGASFVGLPKRLYGGAHRLNWTGSVKTHSDVALSYLRYYLDYLTPYEINQHSYYSFRQGKRFPTQNYLLADAINHNFHIQNTPNYHSLILNWDFEHVTGSSASGQFAVHDFSSGSHELSSVRFPKLVAPWYTASHSGVGFGFQTNSTNFSRYMHVPAYRPQLPEIVSSDDTVNILRNDDEFFTRDIRPIQHFISFEKSPYQTISEEIINYMATVADFSNLYGEAVQKYQMSYKPLEFFKKMFFDRVQNDNIDVDKYFSYYRWFDGALSRMLIQLVPASSDVTGRILNIIEGHVLERSKYQHKFPLLETKTPSDIEGVTHVSHNNHILHQGAALAPVTKSPSSLANRAWWRDRAERNDSGTGISSGDAGVDSDREQIRKVVIKRYPGTGTRTFTQSDGTTKYTVTDAFNDVGGGVRVSVDGDFQKDPTTIESQGTTHHPNIPVRSFSGGSNSATGKQVDMLMTEFRDDTGQAAGQKTFEFSDPSSDEANSLFYGKTSDTSSIEKTTVNLKATSANTPSLDGTEHEAKRIFPFGIFGVATADSTGYKSVFSTGFTNLNLEINNLHDDSYNHSAAETPMQGPFTERHVGGQQRRHVDLNTSTSLDTVLTRPEAFKIDTQFAIPHVAATATITIIDSGSPPGVPFIGEGDTIKLIATDGTAVLLTLQGTGGSTTSSGTSGTTLTAKTLSAGSYANTTLHATAQAVEIRTAINHHTKFTATNSSNVITVTQAAGGASGNTAITITELGATGMSKTDFTGGVTNRKIVIHSPQKGDANLPRAVFYRDEYAKRPVNIRNIQVTGTTSRIGNFFNRYEYVNLVGRRANNRWLRDNESALNATAGKSELFTLIQNPYSGDASNISFTLPASKTTDTAGSIFSGFTLLDRGLTTSSVIFTERFSAPGGPETLSRGFMDRASEEYSPYNALPYRNLTVRKNRGGHQHTNSVGYEADNLFRTLTLTTPLDTLYRNRMSTVGANKAGLDAIFSPVQAAATATITIIDSGSPPGVPFIGEGDVISLIATDGATVKCTMLGTGGTTTNASTGGNVQAKTLSAGSFASTTLHATAQAVEIRTAINHSTRFSATNSANVITITQAMAGAAGNTAITIAELGATGMSKTDFTGGLNDNDASQDLTLGTTGIASFHKTNPNRRRILKSSTGNTTVTSSIFDNGFISRPIPGSDRQYTWITGSLLSGSNGGTMDLSVAPFGYFSLDGWSLSSANKLKSPVLWHSQSILYAASTGGSKGNYTYLNNLASGKTTYIAEVGGNSANTLGLGDLTNLVTGIDLSRQINSTILALNGPYGYPSWKQTRTAQHPVAAKQRKGNIYSKEVVETRDLTTDSSYGPYWAESKTSTVEKFREAPVTSKHKPIQHRFLKKVDGRTKDVSFNHSYTNNLTRMKNETLNEKLNITLEERPIGKQPYQGFVNLYRDDIASLMQSSNIESGLQFSSMKYKETLFPRDISSHLTGSRGRTGYAEEAGLGANGFDRVIHRSFWRDDFGVHGDSATPSRMDGGIKLIIENDPGTHGPGSMGFSLAAGKYGRNRWRTAETARNSLGYVLSTTVHGVNASHVPAVLPWAPMLGTKGHMSGNVTPHPDNGLAGTASLPVALSRWPLDEVTYGYEVKINKKDSYPNLPVAQGPSSQNGGTFVFTTQSNTTPLVAPTTKRYFYGYLQSGGELAHDTSRYIIHAKPTASIYFNRDPYFGFDIATASARHVTNTLGSNIADFTGSAFNYKTAPYYRANKIAKINPWYDSYDDYSEDLRLIAKDYSVIPEFRLSKLVEEHEFDPFSSGNPMDVLRSRNDVFTIDGATEVTASGDTKEYGKGDFSKAFFNDYLSTDSPSALASRISIDHQGDAKTDLAEIEFNIDVVNKFLPYYGLYPATRALRLASLLSQSIGPYMTVDEDVYGGNSVVTQHRAEVEANKLRSLYQPLFAPGIFFNTIKSGIAVDWPIYTGSIPSASAFPIGGGIFNTGEVLGAQNQMFSSGSFTVSNPNYRLPFESVFNLNEIPSSDGVSALQGGGGAKVFKGKPIFYTDAVFNPKEGHATAFIGQYPGLGGTGDQEGNLNKLHFILKNDAYPATYRRAMENFLAGTVDFFLQGSKPTNFTSRRSSEINSVVPNVTYYMDVVLEKRELVGKADFVSAEGPTKQLVPRAMTASAGAAGNMKEPGPRKGYIYGPAAARILPTYVGGQTGSFAILSSSLTAYGQTVASGTVFDGHEMDPCYAPYTPPYFYGSSVLRIAMSASSDEYGTGDIPLDLDQILDLARRHPETKTFNTFNSIVIPTTDSRYGQLKTTLRGTYPDGIPANLLISTASAAYKSAMSITSSIRCFDKINSTTPGQTRENGDNLRWTIRPKFECPIIDVSASSYSDTNLHNRVSGPYFSKRTGRSVWMGYGKPVGQEPVSIISGGKTTKLKKGIVLSLRDSFPEQLDSNNPAKVSLSTKTGSLLSLCGFDKAEPLQSKYLSEMKEQGEVSEAFVLIPYLTNEIKGVTEQIFAGRTPEEIHVIKLHTSPYMMQFVNVLQGKNAVEVGDVPNPPSSLASLLPIKDTTVSTMIKMARKYVLPPEIDFINRGFASEPASTKLGLNTTLDVSEAAYRGSPFAMYIVENEAYLTRSGMANIWQNLLPQGLEAEGAGFVGKEGAADFVSGIAAKKKTLNLKHIVAGHRAKFEFFGMLDNYLEDNPDLNKSNVNLPKSSRMAENYNSLNEILKENIKFLIFKVKMRAAHRYNSLFETPTDTGESVNVPGLTNVPLDPDKTKVPDASLVDLYSFNWPHDYYSVGELAKVNVSFNFGDFGHPGDLSDEE